MSNGQKSDFQDGGRHHLEFQKLQFLGTWLTGFNVWCSVPNFIKIGQFFTEIWRFNDFQNGGRPPCWILKICIFCHVALVDSPFCFLIQNFAEIGQSVDHLWPKKRFSSWIFKNFNFRSRDCYWVQYLLSCTKFYRNRMIFHWDMVI